MVIAQVVGTLVSTIKHPAYHGRKLLVVQPRNLPGAPPGPILSPSIMPRPAWVIRCWSCVKAVVRAGDRHRRRANHLGRGGYSGQYRVVRLTTDSRFDKRERRYDQPLA
ncbi:MAG: EutN/CcmL family microcompartment protein [Anaerolineae bacterium]|nr:MAG: EutN/CcmL family microcompartment protein [Anaerolineae bacterium]